MFKVQYSADYLKKEDVSLKVAEPLDEVQHIEQIKRYRRSDVDSASESRFIQINVPSDGSCLFWAVTLAYLTPIRNNNALFRQRYEALFGNEEIQNLNHIKNLVQNLGAANYDDIFANLVTDTFRNRVVNYMSSRENEFRGFVVDEHGFEHYLEDMRNPNTWGGEPEIRAMSEMLSARITVSSGRVSIPHGSGNIQIQLFHVGAAGAQNHYNFGLEQHTIDNDVEFTKGLRRSMGKERPQDFELIELLIKEAGPTTATPTQQESFTARFQSYIDQIPSYSHSVERAGFFPHFFLGSFSTLLDIKIAEKLDVEKVYFSFDSEKTLRVAVIENGINNDNVVDKVRLFVISERDSISSTQKFSSNELRDVLSEVNSDLIVPGNIKVKLVEIIKDAKNDQVRMFVQVEDKGLDMDHESGSKFKEIKKGLWSNSENDIAGLAGSDKQQVKDFLGEALKKIGKIHYEYKDSLIYGRGAREAAHHAFVAGALNNFHYRYNLRVYLEQFAGRGYADIVLLVRGPERALDSIPIIIEQKAGTLRSADPGNALQQAEGYAKGFQPNVMRVLTTADNVLYVGVNLDNLSPVSNIAEFSHGGRIIPFFQDMLKATDDWYSGTEEIDTVELKKQIKNNLERIYHAFPGTSEKRDNHYFSRFLLGQSLLLDEALRTKFEKYVFIYYTDENIPTEAHPESSRPQRPAAKKAKEALSTNLDKSHAIVSMVLIPKSTYKLVYIINIVEANRKNLLNKALPLDGLNEKIGNRKIVELNLNFDTKQKSNFEKYLTVQASAHTSLERYINKRPDKFQGIFENVPYPSELKETFDKALGFQLSIDNYTRLLKKIGDGVFNFKTLIDKETHFQGVLHGAFSYYSDLKSQESPKTRALVLTEFQTGRGNRIDMLVHGIKFSGQDGNAEESALVAFELKTSRQGKGVQALLQEANDQINEIYAEGVTYKTLTDGSEVNFIGVVFDKRANDPDSLILMSRTSEEGFIRVSIDHSSILSSTSQCSRRSKRDIGMACIDSRDEESIEEQERKEERVKELFDTDEMRERAKSIELYDELLKVSRGEGVDIGEDFITKVRDTDLNSIDQEIRDIVEEIKGRVREEAINKEEVKDILRGSRINEKISKVAKDAGLTYREFLNDRESRSQDITSKINSSPAMNHLNKIGKISGWAMHGMMYKNLIGDILSGNAEGVVINLGFIAGSNALGELANAMAMRGERVISDGKVFLGRSLKAASPFLARATTGFIIYDLINQVKACKSGNKDAMVGIVGDSVVIAIDVAEIGIEVAEVVGILSGVSSITGPIGAAVGAIVFIGTDIYLAVKTVEREDQIIHLTGWEKFKEGWRAFLHAPPEKYIEELMKEKLANNHLVDNAVNFLKQHTSISRYVFPTGRLAEGQQQIEIDSDNVVLLDKKRSDIKWSRARPDNLGDGKLFCLPKGDWESVPGGEAYVCENAIGLSYSSNRTGNYTLIDLGKGTDVVHGLQDNPNIFLIEGDNKCKNFTGGNENDIFVLRGDCGVGCIDGGSGSNTLDLTKFASDHELTVNQSFLKEISFLLPEISFSLKNIRTIFGREKKQDKIVDNGGFGYIDSKGGNSYNPDEICIDHKSDRLKIVLRPCTMIIDGSIKGYSQSINFDGEIEGAIYVRNRTDQVRHNFLFNYTLPDLKNLEVQSSQIYDIMMMNISFSFQQGSSGTFFTTQSIATNASYVLLRDNTEIKVGNKGDLYVMQSTDKPINDIIRNYPPIADRLNVTITMKSQDEFITIGHGKHEVINNEPSHNSHLIGNGGENVYVIAPTQKKVNIYGIHEGTSINTLDLHNVAKDAQNVKISQDENDLLIKLEESSLKFPVRMKNGTQWYGKLHVLLSSVPMQIRHSANDWSLSLAPLIFDKDTKIAVITNKDIEENSKLVIHKQAGQYIFSRLRNDLIITTDLNLEESNACTILFSNFYKEPKMETLSIRFNDITISLQEKINELNNIKLVFCPSVLQISEGLSINGSDLLNSYDCLKFYSDKVAFFRSNDDLLLLSDQGTSLISGYYSQIHERWNLSVELNNDIIKPEEFRERADNPSSFRYYQPGGRGLQIYHNQPINRNDIGLIDLKDKSIFDFDVKVVNDSLVLSSRNNTIAVVESWKTYQPTREMMFAFNDTTVANSKCIVSTCNAEDIIVEFGKEKVASLKKRMFDAIEQGDMSRAIILIEKIGNIDIKNRRELTPLYIAVQEGRLDIVRLLFDRKCVRHEGCIGMLRSHGYKAFKEASRCSYVRILDYIWEKAESLDVQRAMLEANNYEAFKMAAEVGHTQVLDSLWEKAGSPDVQRAMLEAGDYYAFKMAAKVGHTQV
ncbi:MAG: hypothetical protein ACR5K9_03610, partial [Wolbachia sp.]